MKLAKDQTNAPLIIISKIAKNLAHFNQLTYFDFTPVDVANVNTPRLILNFFPRETQRLFLDDRDSYELIEFSSFSEDFRIKWI